jgi:CBS domain containing-hemolysin-like protein
LILIFSEIIPKTIGAQHWRGMAMSSGRIIRGMIILTYPLVIMTGHISKLVSRTREESSISREEISAMAAIGTEEGIIEKKENRIIQNIFRLKHIKAEDIMTPRVVVTVADESMSLKDFLKNKEFLHFSRIPVYANNREDITGYIFRYRVFEKLAEKESQLTLKDIIRDIVVVREAQSLLSLWDMLLKKREHIALVVDEYGGMAGIVTMEDIIESILGLEIVDESDTITDMQQYAREKWNERKAKYNVLDSEDLKGQKKPPQTNV